MAIRAERVLVDRCRQDVSVPVATSQRRTVARGLPTFSNWSRSEVATVVLSGLNAIDMTAPVQAVLVMIRPVAIDQT
jgi:hypothetical protein